MEAEGRKRPAFHLGCFSLPSGSLNVRRDFLFFFFNELLRTPGRLPKASASRRPFSLPAAAGAEGGAAPSPRRRQSRARRAPGAGRDPGHGRDTWTGHPHTRRALACLACLSKKPPRGREVKCWERRAGATKG